MNAPLYTTEILRLAASLPDASQLTREDGSAELRSPTCGSIVRAAVQMGEGRIEGVSLQVQACAFGQAASAIVSRHAVGRNGIDVTGAIFELAAWLACERDDPGTWPEVSALAPARSRRSRHGAILLPFRALVAAIEDAR